jgi:hypothetical protein
LTFVSTINRSYDDSFAKTGAKIGDSLKIRLPNEYTVRTGKTLDAQDTNEASVTLTVATQKGVDMNFSTAELALEMDDFSKRIIEPAVSVLVSNIEYDCLSTVTKDVYNLVGTAGTTPASMLTFGQAKAKLNQYLAPKDGNRSVQLDSIAMATMVNAYSGLFNAPGAISKQYTDGIISHNSGLDWYEQERIYTHTNGADVAGAINDTPVEEDSQLTIDAMSAAPTVGSVFTIAGVKAVHPETKQAYAHEQQFVVTSTVTPTTTTMSFDPPLRASGAKQNIDHLPSDNDVITFVGSASTAYPQHLAYHRDAFAFATADLELPQGVHFAAREVMDGISVRCVRQYDINNDNIPCRIDLLHGYKTIRPQLATRITG